MHGSPTRGKYSVGRDVICHFGRTRSIKHFELLKLISVSRYCRCLKMSYSPVPNIANPRQLKRRTQQHTVEGESAEGRISLTCNGPDAVKTETLRKWFGASLQDQALREVSCLTSPNIDTLVQWFPTFLSSRTPFGLSRTPADPLEF